MAGSLLELAAVLVAVNVVYFAGLIVYRVAFHPLAKYPGPLLNKMTQWPEAKSAWSGNRHVDIQVLHERYGTWESFAVD